MPHSEASEIWTFETLASRTNDYQPGDGQWQPCGRGSATTENLLSHLEPRRRPPFVGKGRWMIEGVTLDLIENQLWLVILLWTPETPMRRFRRPYP